MWYIIKVFQSCILHYVHKLITLHIDKTPNLAQPTLVAVKTEITQTNHIHATCIQELKGC